MEKKEDLKSGKEKNEKLQIGRNGDASWKTEQNYRKVKERWGWQIRESALKGESVRNGGWESAGGSREQRLYEYLFQALQMKAHGSDILSRLLSICLSWGGVYLNVCLIGECYSSNRGLRHTERA